MKLSLLLTSVLLTTTAPACDLCGCYTPSAEAVQNSEHGFFASVAEQFTHFGSIRVDGHEVDNPAHQYEDSSITQFVIGQSFLNHRLTLQVNLPYIDREYQRPEGFATDRGSVSGLGDVSLLGRYQVWSYQSARLQRTGSLGKDSIPMELAPHHFTFSALLKGGVKLPTGDSSRILEEFHEVEVEGAPASGIHGHDLTLGTGSYDAIVGAEIFTRFDRFFFEAETDFTLRGDGRHSYHFANDLTWSGALGYYAIDRARTSLALALATSGETKDTDRFQGREAGDTGITAIYLGPKVVANLGRITAEVGFELPVLLNNTALQAVPDYRIHAALSFHF